jgi:hypothetical protein
MSRNTILTSLRIGNQLLNILLLMLGLAGGYFMTVQSLKLELAAKAESAVVETLDKKLAHLEVILREGVVTRDQFHAFAKEVDHRLGRIEFYLTDTRGVDREKP